MWCQLIRRRFSLFVARRQRVSNWFLLLTALPAGGCVLPESGGGTLGAAGAAATRLDADHLGGAPNIANNSYASSSSDDTGGTNGLGGTSAIGGAATTGGACTQDSGSGLGGCSCGTGGAIGTGGAPTISVQGNPNTSVLGDAGDSCNESFLFAVPPNTMLGYPLSFIAGDQIVSVGAVTSLSGDIPAAPFELVIYASDAQGNPGKHVYTSAVLTSNETTQSTLAPEDWLSTPISIDQTGKLWVMIVTGPAIGVTGDVKVYASNQTTADTLSYYKGPNYANLGTGDAPPAQDFAAFDPSCPIEGYHGTYPHLFVRFIPAN